MREKISNYVELGEGISSDMKNDSLTLSKSGKTISRVFKLPNVKMELTGNKVTFSSDKASKRELKIINSSVSHIKNMVKGLNTGFTYTLEACNVHFPMTLKLEKNILFINNFLGEKTSRQALINPVVKAEIKGQKIILTSHNKEALGETTSNIEKATKVKNRDRRIFQDGIYLTEKQEGI